MFLAPLLYVVRVLIDDAAACAAEFSAHDASGR